MIQWKRLALEDRTLFTGSFHIRQGGRFCIDQRQGSNVRTNQFLGRLNNSLMHLARL